MNAKERDAGQAGGLGRGIESLMATEKAKDPTSADDVGAEGEGHNEPTATEKARTRTPERPYRLAAAVGLMAGGAAGAVAVAAFTLLGVRAVIGMERSRPLLR
ncbi:hypothetical protein B5F40_10920 [Gordonibacter sp. An230]|uniref:hypothetical protein n=1 Tax=Gordonibacter sp. An230 TaxID=1965592 RepID=UPI000B38D99C|nr:hypothetical protein [Gordonibacter sp. An230]OUO89393.1 hypothetical protein B5F40_10920 [Gordonibacter sp. An230]